MKQKNEENKTNSQEYFQSEKAIKNQIQSTKKN